MKIENFDDLIVAFGLLIEEALELDFVSHLGDVHDAFDTAFEEACQEAIKDNEFDDAVQAELEGRE